MTLLLLLPLLLQLLQMHCGYARCCCGSVRSVG
jgi:hypothetical protein